MFQLCSYFPAYSLNFFTKDRIIDYLLLRERHSTSVIGLIVLQSSERELLTTLMYNITMEFRDVKMDFFQCESETHEPSQTSLKPSSFSRKIGPFST